MRTKSLCSPYQSIQTNGEGKQTYEYNKRVKVQKLKVGNPKWYEGNPPQRETRKDAMKKTHSFCMGSRLLFTPFAFGSLMFKYLEHLLRHNPFPCTLFFLSYLSLSLNPRPPLLAKKISCYPVSHLLKFSLLSLSLSLSLVHSWKPWLQMKTAQEIHPPNHVSVWFFCF